MSCLSDRVSEVRARLRVEGASEKTLATIESLLRDAPESAELWLLHADTLHARGETDAARRSYERVLALDPGSLAAHRSLGRE